MDVCVSVKQGWLATCCTVSNPPAVGIVVDVHVDDDDDGNDVVVDGWCWQREGDLQLPLQDSLLDASCLPIRGNKTDR